MKEPDGTPGIKPFGLVFDGAEASSTFSRHVNRSWVDENPSVLSFQNGAGPRPLRSSLFTKDQDDLRYHLICQVDITFQKLLQ